MKHFLFPALLLSIVACGTVRQATPREETRVEVRTETEIKIDTVYLQLPSISQSAQTIDSVSVLENKYAISVAEVSDGILSHSLDIKPVNEPKPVEIKTFYRDSLVFVDKYVEVEVPVEAQLSKWQRFRMLIGDCALVFIFALIVFAMLYILKPFKNVKL